MVLQNHQTFTEMTSNIIYIFVFGFGLKCSHKIHFNTQCPPPWFYRVKWYAKNCEGTYSPKPPALNCFFSFLAKMTLIFLYIFRWRFDIRRGLRRFWFSRKQRAEQPRVQRRSQRKRGPAQWFRWRDHVHQTAS